MKLIDRPVPLLTHLAEGAILLSIGRKASRLRRQITRLSNSAEITSVGHFLITKVPECASQPSENSASNAIVSNAIVKRLPINILQGCVCAPKAGRRKVFSNFPM